MRHTVARPRPRLVTPKPACDEGSDHQRPPRRDLALGALPTSRHATSNERRLLLAPHRGRSALSPTDYRPCPPLDGFGALAPSRSLLPGPPASLFPCAGRFVLSGLAGRAPSRLLLTASQPSKNSTSTRRQKRELSGLARLSQRRRSTCPVTPALTAARPRHRPRKAPHHAAPADGARTRSLRNPQPSARFLDRRRAQDARWKSGNLHDLGATRPALQSHAIVRPGGTSLAVDLDGAGAAEGVRTSLAPPAWSFADAAETARHGAR